MREGSPIRLSVPKNLPRIPELGDRKICSMETMTTVEMKCGM